MAEDIVFGFVLGAAAVLLAIVLPMTLMLHGKEEIISHGGAHYACDAQTGDCVFIWNDEVMP